MGMLMVTVRKCQNYTYDFILCPAGVWIGRLGKREREWECVPPSEQCQFEGERGVLQ